MSKRRGGGEGEKSSLIACFPSGDSLDGNYGRASFRMCEKANCPPFTIYV